MSLSVRDAGDSIFNIQSVGVGIDARRPRRNPTAEIEDSESRHLKYSTVDVVTVESLVESVGCF